MCVCVYALLCMCVCVCPYMAKGGLRIQLTSKQEEVKDNDQCVAEVEDHRSKILQFQLVEVVVHTEEKEVKSSAARGKERPPPPAIVLCGEEEHWSIAESALPVFSLGCFFGGVLHPPIVQIYPPISVSEAAAPHIRMMACKANLYSIIVTKQLYTCKYMAIDCTIVTLTKIGGGFETSALDSTPCTPLFQNSGENTELYHKIRFRPSLTSPHSWKYVNKMATSAETMHKTRNATRMNPKR